MSKFKTINVDLQTKSKVEFLSKKFGMSQNKVIALMARFFEQYKTTSPDFDRVLLNDKIYALKSESADLKKAVLSNELYALRNSITSLQTITEELNFKVFNNSTSREEQVSGTLRKLLVIIKEYLIQAELKSIEGNKAMVLNADPEEFEKIVKQLSIFV